MESLDNETADILLSSQKNEITEHLIYSKLSEAVKDKHNKEILKQILSTKFEILNNIKTRISNVQNKKFVMFWPGVKKRPPSTELRTSSIIRAICVFDAKI